MITPDLIFFGLLIFLMLFCAGSIVFSTIKAGIPPMPSSNKAHCAMLKLVDEADNTDEIDNNTAATDIGAIVDLGSGWGSLVIRIAKKYPQRKIVGYELSFLPWLISKLLKNLLGLNNLTLHRTDFFKVDLSNASVVVCYLYPGAMKKLSDKLHAENNTINFLISNNFSLPTWKPYKTIQIDDFYKSTVYLYKT